jgi:hypothetical protein
MGSTLRPWGQSLNSLRRRVGGRLKLSGNSVRTVASPRSLPLTRLDLAIALFAGLACFTAIRYLADALGRPAALIALVTIPAALLLRSRPWYAAAAMIVGATILRIAHIGLFPTDPLESAYDAFGRILAGQNPYGEQSDGPTYAYGPLGLLVFQLGIPGEIIAAAGTSIVLAWRRAWITLALFSSFPLLLFTASTGANDHTPTFLLSLGLVLLQAHPKLGAVLIACAVAVKPYAAAWVLPAVGIGGMPVLAVGAATTAALWAPLLVWGPASFLESLSVLEAGWLAAQRLHPSWGIDVPVLRWLAVPLTTAGLFVRSWRGACLLGVAAFAVYLGFAPWANVAHFVPIVAVMGLALEGTSVLRRLGQPSPVTHGNNASGEGH